MENNPIRLADPESEIDWMHDAVWMQDYGDIVATDRFLEDGSRVYFCEGRGYFSLTFNIQQQLIRPYGGVDVRRMPFNPHLTYVLPFRAIVKLPKGDFELRIGDALIRLHLGEFEIALRDDVIKNYRAVAFKGTRTPPLYPFPNSDQWPYSGQSF